jgi:hypothetical protein
MLGFSYAVAAIRFYLHPVCPVVISRGQCNVYVLSTQMLLMMDEEQFY